MSAADAGRKRLGNALDLLQVAVETEGDHARIAASGEIDRATVPTLATAVDEMVKEEGVHRITLDLRQVTFLDLSGLHLVCSTASDASRDGFDFEVTRPPLRVWRLFVLAGVEQRVPVAEQ